MTKASVLAVSVLISFGSTALAAPVTDRSINEDEVLAAQVGWCEALLDISATYHDEGHDAAHALAGEVIDAAYGHNLGPVLFKPTLTVNPQTVRTTRAGALSYFVGGDSSYPDDSGFALTEWTNCEIDNAAVFIAGNSASTMGKVHFTNAEGDVTSVDKTWKFVKDDAGNLRIVVHHSSLEYDGE